MRLPFFNFISYLFLMLLLSIQALGQVQPRYVIVPENQVLSEISPTPEASLPSEISILVWNTHKGEAGQVWQEHLQNLTEGKHLVLLQEGMNDSFMRGVLQSISHLGWLMAQNFYMKEEQDATGVITGHKQNPLNAFFRRTTDTEPLAKTPKLALLTSYQMDRGEPLLVINIHGINFTAFPPFRRQIDEIVAVIKMWQGKVIFAGDFNTWSLQRTNYLLNKTKEAGLFEAQVSNRRGLKLDHIFIRGCVLLQMQIHDEITSSDHKPLTADLICD